MAIQLGEIKAYDINELSEILKIHIVTLQGYLRKKKIRGRKIGKKWYVTEEAVKEFIKTGTSEKTKTGKKK